MNDRSASVDERPAAISIALNGEPRDVPQGTTIAALLATLEIATPGTAIAVNDRVIRTGSHGTHELAAGDVVEIVRAASGG